MAPYFMPYFTSCRRTFRLGAIAVAVALLASVACAHNDVVPYSNGTKILTGGHDDLAGTTDELLSVFGYDFGEDPLDPWVIGDPGFNNSSAFTTSFPNAGALPAGALALSVFSGNYGSLHYWDGTGTSAAFSPVASGVEINLNRGSNNLRIGGADADRVHALDERGDGVNPSLQKLTSHWIRLDRMGRVGPLALMRIGELANAQPHLPHIAAALRPACRRPRSLHRRQEQTHERADDGDHNE